MDCNFNYHGPVVVFDLDDTLFRERDFCRSGFKQIERILVKSKGSGYIGISKRMDTLLRRKENYFDWLENLLGENVIPYVTHYRAHRPHCLIPAKGVEEVFENLNKHGIPIAIITDGRSVTQRRKIEALGLYKYINPIDILISEETGADKKSAENFRTIVRHYPEASSFFYVADNASKDFMMANLLGWTTCRVPYNPDNVHSNLDAKDPFGMPMIELKDIRDIVGLVNQK